MQNTLCRSSISVKLPTRTGVPHFKSEFLQGNILYEIKANLGMAFSFLRNKCLCNICLCVWILHNIGKLNYVLIILISPQTPILTSSMRETCKVLAVAQYTTREQTKDSYSLFTHNWNISLHQRQICIN